MPPTWWLIAEPMDQLKEVGLAPREVKPGHVSFEASLKVHQRWGHSSGVQGSSEDDISHRSLDRDVDV